MCSISRIHENSKFYLVILITLFTNYSCENSSSNLANNKLIPTKNSTNIDSSIIKPIKHTIKYDSLELSIIKSGLINIQSLDSNIIVELKYATEDNFMHKNVYGSLTRAYLQKEAAESLLKVQASLKEIHPQYNILIYDAVRPRSVQQFMWDFLDMPISEKTKFVSNPKNGSIHNYGCAVDLTIADSNGIALDMGAKYDEIGKIAYPRLESHFLKKGDLTSDQIENRKLLRKIMKAGDFTGISTEWWHFNRYSRNVAKTKYKIIE